MLLWHFFLVYRIIKCPLCVLPFLHYKKKCSEGVTPSICSFLLMYALSQRIIKWIYIFQIIIFWDLQLLCCRRMGKSAHHVRWNSTVRSVTYWRSLVHGSPSCWGPPRDFVQRWSMSGMIMRRGQLLSHIIYLGNARWIQVKVFILDRKYLYIITIYIYIPGHQSYTW